MDFFLYVVMLVGNLGSDSWSEREQTQVKLEKLHQSIDIVPILENISTSDPEIRARCRRLLKVCYPHITANFLETTWYVTEDGKFLMHLNLFENGKGSWYYSDNDTTIPFVWKLKDNVLTILPTEKDRPKQIYNLTVQYQCEKFILVSHKGKFEFTRE